MKLAHFGLFASFLITFAANAGSVDIEMVVLTKQNAGWRFDVTLRHDDSGWEHFADAWRVVDTEGNVLGTRTLYHPHVSEQPFTRGLSKVDIGSELSVVLVEAHDKVHGWSKARVKINLNRNKGKRFKILR